MIKDIYYSPKSANKNARILFGTALALSFVGFIVYFMMTRYRGFVGLFALFALCIAIFAYTKFLSPVLTYEILFSADEPILVVSAVTGKRRTTYSRITLSSITSVNEETRAVSRAHKTESGYRKYVYCPTLFPPVTYRITTVSRYERAEIVIECDSEFAKTLSDAAAYARENFSEEE